jgi:hypothetical protein
MEEADLLRCLVQVIGRATIPPMEVLSVVGKRKKQIKAFNLCDGSRTLRNIARKSKINQGNLSRTTTRCWSRESCFESVKARPRGSCTYILSPLSNDGVLPETRRSDLERSFEKNRLYPRCGRHTRRIFTRSGKG